MLWDMDKDFQKLMEQVYGPLNKDKMTDLKFTSPSGETTIKLEGTGRLGTVAPKTKLHIKMDKPVKYETPMTKNEEEIEKVKAQIKVLEKKLSFLEELEKTKSPVEEAYKRVYGNYPPTGPSVDAIDLFRWRAFQMGYNAAYEEKVSEEPQKWDAVRESVKWCEEHPDKDPLDWLKPQTPEQTEQSLKEAFKEAQKTEKWKEIQNLIDEEDNDKNFKNSLDLIKEWGEKNKPKTLYQICMEWWDEVFVNEMDDDICVDVLVSKIDKEFIPPSSKKNGYEWEKCLKMMRDKLR